MHVHVNARLTLLTLHNIAPMALMNGHVNEWHGIKAKTNPNLNM